MDKIKITASNPANGSLTLSDHGNSNVKQGVDVMWQIENDSGVKSITAIAMKTSTQDPNTDIFSEAPHQVGASSNWKGTVSETAADGEEYIYFIKWLADDGSGEYIFDPKLKVNSK